MVNNHLMIMAADGEYLARLDASEGRKWRASGALLAHGFNNMPGMVRALQTALEIIRDCDMPKTYHKTKIEVMADLGDVLAKAQIVKEIGL